MSADIAFSDPAGDYAPIRLLVVADRLGPTQEISFLVPLQRWRRSGAAAVRVLDEQDLNNAREDGGSAAVQALLERQFDEFSPTAVVLSRYAGPDYAMLFRCAEVRGLKVAYHLDDDLFEVPIALGTDLYRRYRHPRRVYSMYSIAERAGLIYASTPALAERIVERCRPRRVMTSPIYVGLETRSPSSSEADRQAGLGAPIRIGYMGSAGHAFDLEMITPAIRAVLDRFPQVSFELFGTIANTAASKSFGDRVSLRGRVDGDYLAFRSAMGGLGWDIGLAPLRDEPFNACKAPTKWVEYTEAGIPVIASATNVYLPLARRGAVALAGPEDWNDAITALVTDPNHRSELLANARRLAAREFSWSRTEEQVLELLAALEA